MVHDRRVNDEILVFGNQGGLFRNAMTWWDHSTGSVWSQVWGQAIDGPRKGTTLELIPASIVPWGAWRAEHPATLALLTGKDGFFKPEERPRDGWVVGIALGEHRKAFDYRALVREGVVNDSVGPYPVVLVANADTRQVAVYLRQVAGQTRTFQLKADGTHLLDPESGATWTVGQGLPGPDNPAAEALRPVPYMSSYDDAWLDFHPGSEIYR